MFWKKEKSLRESIDDVTAKNLLAQKKKDDADAARRKQLHEDILYLLEEKPSAPEMSGLAAWIAGDLYGIRRANSLKNKIMQIVREEIDRKPDLSKQIKKGKR